MPMALKFVRGQGDGQAESGEGQKADNTHSPDNKSKWLVNYKDRLYRLSYYTGVQLMRFGKRIRRHAVAAVLDAQDWLLEQSAETRERAAYARISLRRTLEQEFFSPVRAFRARVKELRAEYDSAKSQGGDQMESFLAATSQELWAETRKVLGITFNYVAPLGAAALLFVTITTVNSFSFGLKVEYNSKVVGYVRSEADFEVAQAEMKKRIIYEDYIQPEDAVPRFTMAIVNDKDIISTNDLTDRLIESSGNELQEAYGLYIDNQFMGATTDGDSLLENLNARLEEYSTGAKDEKVSFVKDVQVREGLYPLTSIVDLRNIESELDKDESEERIYTVQKGDAPTLIAQKYDMRYSDLKELNPEIETELFVGQEVLISRSVPFLGVQVTKTVTETEDIPYEIEQVTDNSYNEGFTKVSVKGQTGEKEVTSQITYVDGVETERIVLDSRVVKEPVTQKVIVGGNKPLSYIPTSGGTNNGGFIWPVGGNGGYVSCRIWGYSGHTGVDIASQPGTPIYAAAAGQVVTAQYWGGAYGHYVKIGHGNGLYTLYAHNSKLYVNPGDYVEQGQLIAAMGRTGRATGNHCHFEIINNGRYLDPLQYVG